MDAISLWISKTTIPSDIDKIVIKIALHNRRMIGGTYYFITNMTEDTILEGEAEMENLQIISYEKFRRFEHEVLGENLDPNFASDLIPIWGQFLVSSKEGLLYLDADFVLSNSIALSELSLLNKFCLFKDKNFYRIKITDPSYINAHLSYFPSLTNLSSEDKEDLNYEIDFFKQKFIQHYESVKDHLEYRDLGPRFYNTLGQPIYNPNTQRWTDPIIHRLFPNTPNFGAICRGDVSEDIEVEYTSESLGVHLLFSLFRLAQFEPYNIKFTNHSVIISIK